MKRECYFGENRPVKTEEFLFPAPKDLNISPSCIAHRSFASAKDL